jgi:predicted HicB family RNase H-like nuclease
MTHMEIRVRNVPPALHRELRIMAAMEETSLNALIIRMLEDMVKKSQGKK